MRPARRTSQQPAEQHSATTFVVPSSTSEVVAPRATMITRPTNPPYYGSPRRSNHHHHPTMMQIFGHPAQTIVHHSFASAGPLPRSFNGVNSHRTPDIGQFAAAPTPSFPPHSCVTSSSPVEGGLPYRGQVITEGQSSTSTLNHHLLSPDYYPQMNATTPDMAGNAMWPQNTIYYFAPAGTPDDNTQVGVASPVTIRPPNPYSTAGPYHNPSSLRNVSYSNPDGPEQQSSTCYYYPQADVLHNQPDVPTTSTSQPGINRSHTQESRPCRWLGCVFEGSIDALKAHFMKSHLTGPQDAQVTCLWDGCHYSRRGNPEVHTMRRDSAWRHALEKHLDVKYRKKG